MHLRQAARKWRRSADTSGGVNSVDNSKCTEHGAVSTCVCVEQSENMHQCIPDMPGQRTANPTALEKERRSTTSCFLPTLHSLFHKAPAPSKVKMEVYEHDITGSSCKCSTHVQHLICNQYVNLCHPFLVVYGVR